MFSSMSELERQLREGADDARQPAPARLRERLIARIGADAVGTRAASHSIVARWSPWRLAAAAGFLLLAGLSAALLLRGGEDSSVTPPVERPRHVVIDPQWFDGDFIDPALPRVSLSSPFVREAQLLARDAQRTVALFRGQVPRLPRIDVERAPSDDEHG